ncbi:LytS/YehU family sensor histidine kinase [Ulvibacter sp. MAR_2010_11]|uniref:2TM domain-containing protein n=1 Tax=Ulvibacter sp. MAR_2010_11 TaxID=1250229 RepID=UPI000C2B6C8A|nr:2TM domain-containing protein [Ulvibacter sp. MAR_2010_11]PKA83862.1 LytS/YehU family sensor histidine kinase [Ulvibacter sp. MAR_2010_11]
MKLVIKEFGKAFSLGILIFIVLEIIQYLNGYRINSIQQFFTEFGYNQLYSVVLYMANAFFIFFLMKKYKGELFKTHHLTRGILGGIGITILCLLFLRFTTEVIIEGKTFSVFLTNEKLQYYYVSFIISAVITTIFYAVYYYRFTQERKVKEQKIIAGTASAKFDALKNQLDPHFLFNSLNVLTSLIEENPEAATKFTTSLSKVYRYVLEQKNKELVTVAEELKFAELYMSLLKMRFEDSIVFTISNNISNPEAKVIPLALQLVLENAVKHNMVTPSKKLHITIFEEEGNLVIKNNVQPKQVVKESSGVGLRNIRQRYFLLTNRAVQIKENDKEFSIAIPMLTQETKAMHIQETYISEKKYERAKKRVEELKGFYVHLTIYLIMVPVFIFLNYKSTGFPWAIFPIAGWGFGVMGHAMEVFNYNPFLGKNWEDRKLRELMDKDDFKEL